MELNQLRYFQVVAKHQHMTRAANELQISQSSLSKTITALEKDVGANLFDRIGGRIVLNAVGKQFLERIDRSLMEIDDAVREANTNDTGQVTFAAGNSATCASYMYNFIQKHLSIRLNHYPMPNKRMHEALEQGGIDFALSYDNLTSEKILWQPLVKEEVLLLVSCRHASADRNYADLEEFKDDLFIFNNSDFGATEIGDYFCKQAGFEPRILFEGDEPRLALRLVSDNYGVMFMSTYEYRWHTAPEIVDTVFSTIKAIHLESPNCCRVLGLAQLKNHYISPSAQLFISGLKEFFCSNKL